MKNKNQLSNYQTRINAKDKPDPFKLPSTDGTRKITPFLDAPRFEYVVGVSTADTETKSKSKPPSKLPYRNKINSVFQTLM